MVDGLTQPSSIQVNYVQSSGAGGEKLARLLNRVGLIGDLPVILALDKPYTFAADKLDNRLAPLNS